MDQMGSAESGLDAVVVVRLRQDLREALRARAAREDRTVASLLRVAARAYLDAVDEQRP